MRNMIFEYIKFNCWNFPMTNEKKNWCSKTLFHHYYFNKDEQVNIRRRIIMIINVTEYTLEPLELNFLSKSINRQNHSFYSRPTGYIQQMMMPVDKYFVVVLHEILNCIWKQMCFCVFHFISHSSQHAFHCAKGVCIMEWPNSFIHSFIIHSPISIHLVQ